MQDANEFLQSTLGEVADTPAAAGTAGDSARPTDFHIVGIGASAGGLDSLERLFTHLPTDTGMAFVVLQHLSPDFESLMDELFARRTTMPIRQAEHDLAVEPNTVYLLPPTKEMIIRGCRLLCDDRDPRLGPTLPIDLFLRSLAQDAGPRAVAVILSGSGSDGSRGIRDVRKAGGTVFCESTETARFNGMPLSAMRTGSVDQVLPPEEIAVAIAALVQPHTPDALVDEGAGAERRIDAILRLLRDDYGIDFSHYAAATVTRRIERRLALKGSLDLDTYVKQLHSDPRELSSLYEDLLIGVTQFFRDEDAFEALEHRIVPDVIEHVPPEEQIRVWVPGCATGQEAYSIAMLLYERLAACVRPFHVKILATDVHKASLDAASAGIYSEAQVAGVGPDRLDRFFTLKPGGYQISETLRESIVFAPHNLIRDAPFTKMDLIACRNLLIYFQPHAQRTVLALFHFSLKPGGFLFLGSSESPGGLADEFDTIDDRAKIYRKRRDTGLPRDLKLALPRSRPALRPLSSQPLQAGPRTGVQPQLMATYDRLLDRFMPPAFLVDEHGYLVDAFGGIEALLKVKARRPTQNLLEMLDGDLRTAVSGVLHRIRHDVERVGYPVVPLSGDRRGFALIAEPLRDRSGALTHILVSLVDSERGTAAALVPPYADVPGVRLEPEPQRDAAGPGRLSREQVEGLEQELVSTREHLQSVVREHEAASEELQATNEELIAANEELQSTNEELHSINEEMYTVNAEYQKRNLELQELNDDIEHLLNGTDVATVFLDSQLRIRKFTPRIADIFTVIPQDVGRPLPAFAHVLLYDNLVADLERVLHEGITLEGQTRDRHQRCYFVRMLPYHARRKDQTGPPPAREGGSVRPSGPDGVVLTLTDISALDQARSRLAQLSAIVESSDDAIVGTNLDGLITTWNTGAYRLYGYTVEEAVGRHASFLYPPGHKEEIDTVLPQVRAGRPVERLEATRIRKDGTAVDVAVTYSPILDSSNRVVGVSAIARDITQLVRARLDIAEREERIRLLLDSTAEAIYGIDLTGVCTFCNSACARLLGYESPAALIGRQMHQLIRHTRPDGTPYPPEQSAIYDAMRHRKGTHVDDEVIWRADGTSFPAEYWSHPILRNQEVIGAVVTLLDVTERRRADQELQEGVRRREQFLAMLSHELRNPLAAILSAMRVLDAGSRPEETGREAAQVVTRQANHMARLLDDLLDVARITRGRIALRKEHLDLRDTARSAIEALGPLMSDRQTRLVVEIADEPVPVFGDAARLQQIQANLLSNASKYSPFGGEIRFALTRDAERAIIRVTDRGRGIEPDVLPRIFDLFVQGDQTIARSEGGLGIGLTLLRTLVELHDGAVEAHSAGPGQGSTFTVRLPLASAAHAGESALEPEPAPMRTVALVEDQPDSRRMLQFLLEAHGLQVFTAADGLEGARLIGRVRPDLALVDLGLPVMSGFDLAREVRRNGGNARTRLVALSGYGQESDVQAALDAGFDEHLTKPPDPARLELLLTRGRSV